MSSEDPDSRLIKDLASYPPDKGVLAIQLSIGVDYRIYDADIVVPDPTRKLSRTHQRHNLTPIAQADPPVWNGTSSNGWTTTKPSPRNCI